MSALFNQLYLFSYARTKLNYSVQSHFSWTPCSTLKQVHNSLAWNWECSCFKVYYRLRPLKKYDKILLKVHSYSNVVVCSKNFVGRYQCTLGTGKTKQQFVLFIPIPKARGS